MPHFAFFMSRSGLVAVLLSIPFMRRQEAMADFAGGEAFL